MSVTSAVVSGLTAAAVSMSIAALGSAPMDAAAAGRAIDANDVSATPRIAYLALGDSYTIGEGVAPEGRWPMRLAAALRERGVAIDDPRIVARTGWTTDELSAAIDAEFPDRKESVESEDAARDASPTFGFVTLLIGVNNQYRGRSVDEYAQQFEALLERAIRFAGDRADRTLVLAIPDWGVTPFAARSGRDTARIARELDAFNAAAQTICARRGVAFVDIAPIARAHGGEAAMLADDGLHPSVAMYALWADAALPTAARLLRNETR